MYQPLPPLLSVEPRQGWLGWGEGKGANVIENILFSLGPAPGASPKGQ
jgi:hypothetical protein